MSHNASKLAIAVVEMPIHCPRCAGKLTVDGSAGIHKCSQCGLEAVLGTSVFRCRAIASLMVGVLYAAPAIGILLYWFLTRGMSWFVVTLIGIVFLQFLVALAFVIYWGDPFTVLSPTALVGRRTGRMFSIPWTHVVSLRNIWWLPGFIRIDLAGDTSRNATYISLWTPRLARQFLNEARGVIAVVDTGK